MYLNNWAYWRKVPAASWNYHLGGYQVLKKWLPYRERKIWIAPCCLSVRLRQRECELESTTYRPRLRGNLLKGIQSPGWIDSTSSM